MIKVCDTRINTFAASLAARSPCVLDLARSLLSSPLASLHSTKRSLLPINCSIHLLKKLYFFSRNLAILARLSSLAKPILAAFSSFDAPAMSPPPAAGFGLTSSNVPQLSSSSTAGGVCTGVAAGTGGRRTGDAGEVVEEREEREGVLVVLGAGAGLAMGTGAGPGGGEGLARTMGLGLVVETSGRAA